MNRISGYQSSYCTAWVAGIFSVLVGLLLIVDFARRPTYLPLESPAFADYQDQFVSGGHEDDARRTFRELDLEMRQALFRQQVFLRRGAWLLLGGCALTLAAAHRAAALHTKLPMPEPGGMEAEYEARATVRQRYAVIGTAFVLLAVTGVWAWHARRTAMIWPAGPPDSALAEMPLPGATQSPEPTPSLPDGEVYARQWPRFRGPRGDGVAPSGSFPTQWDAASGQGIRWRTDIPLPGVNSPVVWEKKVFLSGATREQRQIFCFDADSGRLLWTHDIPTQADVSESALHTEQETGFAAPTLATDGVRVFAIFATGDLVACDFQGQELWHRSLGVPKNPYGHASSLATYRDRVIVQLDQGTVREPRSKLVAFDGASGKTAWEVARDVASSWSSPIVVEQGGQPLVITASDPWVIGCDPETGAERWRIRCMRGDVGPSPAYAAGLVYVANEQSGIVAVRADGDGDATATHVAWKADAGSPDICSPLVTGDCLLVLTTFGTLTCYDRMQGGEPLWEEDFGESFEASPSLVGSYVYMLSEEGTMWIVEANRAACRRIGQARLSEPCSASPAFASGRIYVRGREHLVCLEDLPAAQSRNEPPSGHSAHPSPTDVPP